MHFLNNVRALDLPQDWKDTYISAIFEKRNKRKQNNYRLVSLTCIECKILESLIRDHIIQYMKPTNFSSSHNIWKMDILSTTESTGWLDRDSRPKLENRDNIVWLHEGLCHSSTQKIIEQATRLLHQWWANTLDKGVLTGETTKMWL